MINIRLLLLSLTLTVLYAQSNNTSIFVADLNPGWPTLLAANIPSTINLSPKATFHWTFSNLQSQACTSYGVANINPCTGRVIQYMFQQVGSYPVELTVQDTTLSAPIVISTTVNIKPLNAFPVAMRPEVRAVPMDDWNGRTIKALYALQSLGIYYELAKMHWDSVSIDRVHGTGRTAAHNAPAFLLFHRALMRVVERCMQVALNDDTYGLPYFEWLQTWEGMENYVGGTGDQNNYVKDGPFCNNPSLPKSQTCPKLWILPSDFPDDNKALKRQLGATPSIPFHGPRQLDKLLSMPYYDLAPFDDTPTENSFRSALEGGLGEKDPTVGLNHNGIHQWVGGHFANVGLAMYDPFFLFHHSEVDRLLTLWQKKNNCVQGQGNNVCYRPLPRDPGVSSATKGAVRDSSTGQYVLKGQTYDDAIYPWGMKISTMLVSNQGYDYLPSKTPPPIPSNKANAGADSSDNSKTVGDKPGKMEPLGGSSMSVHYSLFTSFISVMALCILL